MNMSWKVAVALTIGTLGGAAGGAYAASSHSSHTARVANKPSRIQAQITVAGRRVPRALVTNRDGIARAALSKAVGDSHISENEASLGRLLLDGSIAPDHALRNSWRAAVRAAAKALGISAASLQTDLNNGEPLSEVARQQGRSPAVITRAIENATKNALANGVADGALTPAASADIGELLRTHLRDVLEHHTPSAAGTRRPSPLLATKAFGQLLERRFGSARGFWACAAAQIVVSDQIDCLAEVLVNKTWHQTSALAALRNGQVVLSQVRDTKWARHWLPYSRRFILRSDEPQVEGVISVNGPAFDWGFLALCAERGTPRRCVDHAGNSSGLLELFAFRCSGAAVLVTCTNALGDSMRYRPHSK